MKKDENQNKNSNLNTFLSALSDNFCILNKKLEVVYSTESAYKYLFLNNKNISEYLTEEEIADLNSGSYNSFKKEFMVSDNTLILKFINLNSLNNKNFKNMTALLIEDITENAQVESESLMMRNLISAMMEISRLDMVKPDYIVQYSAEQIASFSESAMIYLSIEDIKYDKSYSSWNSAVFHYSVDLKTRYEEIFSNLENTQPVFESSTSKVDDEFSYCCLFYSFGDRLKGKCGIIQKKKDFDDSVVYFVNLYINILISEIGYYFQDREIQKNDEVFSLARFAANIGVWELKADIQSFSCSDEIEHITGRAEINNYKDFLKVIYEQDLERFEMFVKNSFVKSEPVKFEHRIVMSNGAVRWVEESGDIIEDENGRPERLLCIMQDKTEYHKLFEETLLEKEQKKIAEAERDEAVSSNKEKNLLIIKIVENLKAKISSLRKFLTSSQSLSESVEAVEIQRVFDRTDSVFSNIRDYINIESGNFYPEKDNIPIDEVFSSLAETLAADCADEVELFFEKDPKVPDVLRGDFSILRKILLTLSYNAVKYTGKGVVKVRANLKKYLENSNQCVIEFSVQDTGSGIKSGSAKFYNKSGIDTGEESGLSNSLTYFVLKKLIESIHGTLEVDSQEGKGTIFYFDTVLDIPETVDESVSGFNYGLQALVIDETEMFLDSISDYLFNLSISTDSFSAYNKAVSVITKSSGLNSFYKLIVYNAADSSRKINNFFSELEKLKFDRKEIVIVALDTSRNKQNLEYADIIIRKPFTKFKFSRALTDSNKLKSDLDNLGNSVLSYKYDGVKLLLVEDEKINQRITEQLLKSLDIEVDFADNGREAVDILKRRGDEKFYDIILMDLQMPQMSGMETSQYIRNELGWSEIPIVAMTARTDSALYKDILNSGMNETVPKPINIKKFQNIIKRFIATDKISIINSKQEEKASGKNSTLTQLINFDEGLSRVAGNKSLFIELLESFYNSNTHFTQKLRDFLTLKEYEQSENEIHVIKGTSGNLGLERLYETAKDVEKSIKFNHDDVLKIQSGVDSFTEILKETLEAIKSFIAEEKDK